MKPKTLFIISLFLFYISVLFCQTEVNRFRIKGQIFDKNSKSPIAKFPIKIKEFNRTVFSDEQGKFLFNMSENSYIFIFDDYPYIKKELSVQLNSDTTLTIIMETPSGFRRLQEVEVVANRVFTDKSASITKLGNIDLATLPAMIGERDILKVLSLNAGVTSSGEGVADMQVRGGIHGQNLFLLDKIPLYSTQHMFGMISVYNPAILKSAELYKAGFPAEYGGRIASVLDVRTKDPNLNKLGGEIDLSLLASKVSANIPLVKNKLGVTIAGRISNYSLLNLISIMNLIDKTKLGLHFADVNAGVLYKPTDKDELKLSFFYNSDGLNVKQNEEKTHSETWQNNRQQNVILNWQRKLSSKSVNTLQFYTDSYKFNFGFESLSINGLSQLKEFYRINSNIYSSGMENQISCDFSEILTLNSGLAVKTYQFSPFNIGFTDSSFISSTPIARQYESILFTQSKYTILPKQTIDVGLRFSRFGNADNSYLSFEPRFSYHGMFTDNLSLSASVSEMTQNIHRVANPGLGIPVELFQSSDGYLQPEKSWIYSLGAAKELKKESQSISVKADFWYKKMWNLVEFKDGYDAFSIILSDNYTAGDNSSYLTLGNGKAYGVDISAVYTIPKFKFSVDYTLMEARNQFDELNNGLWFAASSDIRHSLSLVSELKLKRNWSFSATWQLRSGRPITLPTAIYPISEIDFNTGYVKFLHEMNVQQQLYQTVETERNNFRMRPFHKLDVAFNRTYLIGKKYTSSLSIGLYNVYNRANAAYYFIGKNKIDGTYYPVLKSISMFPILPSFSWNMKF